MISRRRFALLTMSGLTLAACGRAGGLAGEPAGEVRLGILSPDPPSVLAANWAPILADLRAATGLDATPAFFDNGPEMVDALSRGRMDVGWFDNLSGLEAVRRAGGEVFARPIPLGLPAHAVLLAAPRRRRVTLRRVLRCDRTLRIGLGDPLSIPGSLALETYLLAPAGKSPSTCFREVRRQPAVRNLADLSAGRLDLAAIGAAQWAKESRNLPVGAADIREIWRSPALPADPFVWRKDLDPAAKETIRQFLLTYGQDNAVQRARLSRIGLVGFAPADDNHLLPTREMEAVRSWLEAQRSGDRARAEAARADYESVAAERQALEARTGAPAAAQ